MVKISQCSIISYVDLISFSRPWSFRKWSFSIVALGHFLVIASVDKLVSFCSLSKVFLSLQATPVLSYITQSFLKSFIVVGAKLELNRNDFRSCRWRRALNSKFCRIWGKIEYHNFKLKVIKCEKWYGCKIYVT